MERSALLVVLAFVGCSSEPAAPAARPQPEVRSAVFESLPRGWHQFEEEVQRLGRCHTVTSTLATTWRADRAGSHGWASEMPRDAIAITVGLLGPPRPTGAHAHYPPIGKMPLRLPPTTVSILEGSPHVPEYRAFGRTPDYLVEVRADINNPAPGLALLAEARAVVNRLRLPDWPELC